MPSQDNNNTNVNTNESKQTKPTMLPSSRIRGFHLRKAKKEEIQKGRTAFFLAHKEERLAKTKAFLQRELDKISQTVREAKVAESYEIKPEEKAPAQGQPVKYGEMTVGHLMGDGNAVFKPTTAFFSRLTDLLVNTIHSGGVNVNLGVILKNAGSKSFGDDEYVDAIRKNVGRVMLGKYGTNHKIAMSELAAVFFESVCEEIKNEEWSPKERIINAQKIADLMIKNYSPVAYEEDALGRYADSYVLNNKELLREQLKKQNLVPENEIEALIQEVAPMREGEPEVEQPVQEEIAQEPVQSEPEPQQNTNNDQNVNEEQNMNNNEQENVVEEQINNDTHENPVEEEVVIHGVSARNRDDQKDVSFTWTEELFDEMDDLFEDNYELAKETKEKIVEVLTDVQFRYIGNSLMVEGCFVKPAKASTSFGYATNKLYMSQVASKFFKEAYEGIKADRSLDGATKIVAAQRIADIVIKNYFPMVNNKGFERFANNYMLRNDKYLEKMMVESKFLSENDAARVIQEAKESVDIGPEIEQEVTEEVPRVEVNEQEPVQELIVEEPAQVEPAQEQPVEEQPVEEPIIEEIKEPAKEETVQEPIVEEPVQEQIVQEPAQNAPVQEQLVEEQPVEEPIIEEIKEPVQEAPVEEPIIEEIKEPAKEEPVQQPVQEGEERIVASPNLSYNFPKKFGDGRVEERKLFFKDTELNDDGVIEELDEEAEDVVSDYEIEEIAQENGERSSDVTHRVSMPDFDERLAARRDNSEITERVMITLSNIVTEAGVTFPTSSSIVNLAYDKLSAKLENNVALDGKDAVMHDVAMAFFGESYDVLNGAGLTTTDRLLTAQKIANVMIKTYSPAGFTLGALDQYTKDYVVSNETLLEKTLREKENLSQEEAEPLIWGVNAALRNAAERQEPEDEMSAEAEMKKYAPRFRKQFAKRLENDKITMRVNHRIADILRESGVDENLDTSGFVNEVFGATIDNIKDQYDLKVSFAPTVWAKMSEVAKQNYRLTYLCLKNSGIETRNDYVTAQRITDLLLKNYSLLAFTTSNALNKYSDNYVIRDKAIFQDVLEFSDAETEAAFQGGLVFAYYKEMEASRQYRLQKMQAAAAKKALEQGQPVQEQPVQEPVQEAPVEEPIIEEIKEEPVKEEHVQEQPVQEPAKEQPVQEPIIEEIKEPAKEEPVQEPIVEEPAQNEPVQQIIEEIKPPVQEPIEEQIVDPAKEAPVEEPIFIDQPVQEAPAQNEPEKNEPEKVEDRAAREIAFATARLKELERQRGGTTEDRRDREWQKKYYQGILDKYKTAEDWQREAMEIAERAREEARRREALQRQLEEELRERENSENQEAAENEELREVVAEENGPDLTVNENGVAQPIYIPDFYDKLEKRLATEAVTKAVMDEMTDIIKATGIEDHQTAYDIAERAFFVIGEGLQISYSRDGLRPKTREAVESYFENANYVLRDTDLNLKDRLITAQKVADVMIRNYSPITFADHQLDSYADNYVLKDEELLRKQLRFEVPQEQIEPMMQQINAALLGLDVEVPDAPEEPENRPEEPKPENRPEEHKPEDPKPEAEKAPRTANVNMPEFFAQLDQRMTETAVAEDVKAQISAAISGAGIEDKETVTKLTGDAYAIVAEMHEAFEPYAATDDTIIMRDFVECIFNAAYGVMSESDLQVKTQLGVAQQITDVLLKNYSPAAFADGKLDRYTNSYVLRNEKRLANRLKSLNFSNEEAETLAKEVVAERAQNRNTEVKQEVEKNDLTMTHHYNERERLEAAEKLFEEEMEKAEQQADEAQVDESIPREYRDMTEEEVQARLEDIQMDILNGAPLEGHSHRLFVPKDKRSEGVAEDAYEGLYELFNEPIDDSPNVSVFVDKLAEFNNMYKVTIDANVFASTVSDSWELLKSSDEQKQAEGKKMLSDLFKDTLKKSFAVEKELSYNEHRLPDYSEIAKSANGLLRASMFAFTDLYHDFHNEHLFAPTAFGGLNEKDMAELARGKSSWSMDQLSDEAWEIQSKEAKEITEEWLKDPKPYERMIKEMKGLIAGITKDGYNRREARLKLTAAEWLLVNNEKMMIEDPEDPLNPIPNWGNRYWKAITEARDALGIDKHTSMRDMIQAEYAAAAKSVKSLAYNTRQFYDHIIDPKAREAYDFDSLENQKMEFATISAANGLAVKNAEKRVDAPENKADAPETEEKRVREPVESQNEAKLMKQAVKNYKDFIVGNEKTASLKGPDQSR